MEYQSSSYEIADQNSLSVQTQQYHREQNRNVLNCVCKLKEFLDVADSIAAEYEDVAVMQCIMLMEEYYRSHGRKLHGWSRNAS